MSFSSSNTGSERLKADIRQFGGLALALGICTMFQGLAGVASGVSRDGGTPNEGVPLWSLIGSVCLSFIGATAIVVGYLSVVADTGHRYLTLFLCVVIQLAWIPYITGMTGVGKQTANPETQTFIPADLEPTDNEVQFVGFIGILAILAHGFAFVGSLSFISFSLLAYQSNKFQDRPASYYQGRLLVYSLVVVLAGFTQLALGAFILEKYQSGPLDNAVNIAVYTIFFPEISVFVGLVQLLTGSVGVYKYFGGDVLEGIWPFQFMCLFMWLMMMILQLMVQVSFAPGAQFAAAAPTRACMLFGMAFMPAYLDYKTKTTPDVMDESYYGGLIDRKSTMEMENESEDVVSVDVE